jgi:TusA-related sulfurtransferase
MKRTDTTDPIDIMLDCCIPNKKKLMGELSKLPPGDTLQVKIDNSIATKALVESFLKNTWCRIVKTVDGDDSSILHIHMDGRLIRE